MTVEITQPYCPNPYVCTLNGLRGEEGTLIWESCLQLFLPVSLFFRWFYSFLNVGVRQ